MISSHLINRSSIMLAFAILAGLGAAWAARQHIQGRVALLESQARVPEVARIVAASDLPAGTRLETSHLAIRSFPASVVASDSLIPARFSELEGMLLRSPLVAGDAVLPVHVQRQKFSAFSTSLISGRRAITMPVDAINSVSGLLRPGDLIDLYVSFEYQRRRITAPLLQGVLVLATGMETQTLSADERETTSYFEQGYTTVTLDVAPEDAVKLVAARQSGTITAILRNPGDSVPSSKASRGDLATLLGVNVEGPPPRIRKVPVLYGNTSIRSVPRLQAPVPRTRQSAGVFDLPYTPELTSAWMHGTRPPFMPHVNADHLREPYGSDQYGRDQYGPEQASRMIEEQE